MKRLYPRATENRLDFFDPEMIKIRRRFMTDAAKNFLLLHLLFLSLFAYAFGSLYQQDTHTHNLTVVFVDYDGGAIGQAVRNAYGELAAATFPTLIEQPPSAFATPGDLQDTVCATQYWAALYVVSGASERLHAALQGAPSTYNRTDVMTYIWDEARYPLVVDPGIASNLQTLASAARVAYTTTHGTGNVSALSGADALAVFANPWTLTSTNLQETTQGARAVYNTIVIILIMIQGFFYLAIINHLYGHSKILSRAKPHFIVLVRDLSSLTYTLVGSLCTAGAIWAFRSGWDVNANQFVLTWVALWLFAHLNFVTLDVFSIWLPVPYVPMALISWVVLNVTSILLPFELSPAFFHLGYALPAHGVYQVMADVWSRGCNGPQLRSALPVMFAWELAGLVLSALGAYRRAHYATIADEAQEHQFRERLDAAVEFEMKRNREIHAEDAARSEAARAKTGATATAATAAPEGEVEEKTGGDAAATGVRGNGAAAEGEAAKDYENAVREELSQVISNADEQARQQRRRANLARGFGPSFALPFGTDDGDES